MERLSFYNEWHLGDCIFNINYINRLLLENDIGRIDFFIKGEYISQVSDFIIDSDRVCLHELRYKDREAINLWIGQDGFVFKNRFSTIYDLMYLNFWSMISRKLSLQCPIRTKEENLILFKSIGEPRKTFDVLFVNSKPLSGQVEYSQSCYEKVTSHIARRGLRVCTTSPVDGVACTLSDNLSLYDIGNLAARCKYVIGIHTGPLIPTLNETALRNVSNYIVLDRRNHFSYEKYIKCYSNEEFLQAVNTFI